VSAPGDSQQERLQSAIRISPRGETHQFRAVYSTKPDANDRNWPIADHFALRQFRLLSEVQLTSSLRPPAGQRAMRNFVVAFRFEQCILMSNQEVAHG
jgi:hypothetical protein